jgi:hypothetical protein
MIVIIKEWGCFARQKRFLTQSRKERKQKLKCRVKEKKLNYGIARLPAGLLGGKNHEKKRILTQSSQRAQRKTKI